MKDHLAVMGYALTIPEVKEDVRYHDVRAKNGLAHLDFKGVKILAKYQRQRNFNQTRQKSNCTRTTEAQRLTEQNAKF